MINNLDEAIKHCEEKAKEQRTKAVGYFNGGYSSQIEGKFCLNCAEEHEQLASWLKELKAYKERPQGDLISREALKNDFDCVGFNDYDDYNRALRIIDNAPTVDMNTELSVAYLKGRMQGQSDVKPQGGAE